MLKFRKLASEPDLKKWKNEKIAWKHVNCISTIIYGKKIIKIKFLRQNKFMEEHLRKLQIKNYVDGNGYWKLKENKKLN
jgi:hypothetical protein